MPLLLAFLTVAAAATPGPLILEVNRGPTAVEIDFALTADPPETLFRSLAAGAEARLSYPLRVRAKRKAWWDWRVWSGEVVAVASLDPVIGRYRCQVILNGIITSIEEFETADDAVAWVTDPPPVRVELPSARRDAVLRVRVRAVFSSGTTWLIFPTQDATPWVETTIESPRDTTGPS